MWRAFWPNTRRRRFLSTDCCCSLMRTLAALPHIVFLLEERAVEKHILREEGFFHSPGFSPPWQNRKPTQTAKLQTMLNQVTTDPGGPSTLICDTSKIATTILVDIGMVSRRYVNHLTILLTCTCVESPQAPASQGGTRLLKNEDQRLTK